MPGKSRDDVFIEKLTDLLKEKQAAGEPINPTAGGEGEGNPLAADVTAASRHPQHGADDTRPQRDP